MRISTKQAASAVAAVALMTSIAVGLFASVAVAAKPLKPGRVIVSADVLFRSDCAPSWVAPTAGHIQVNAVDLDTSVTEHSWSSQNDRMALTGTRGDTAFSFLELTRLEILDESDAYLLLNGALVLHMHDGGNPGVANDWMTLRSMGVAVASPSPLRTATSTSPLLTQPFKPHCARLGEERPPFRASTCRNAGDRPDG